MASLLAVRTGCQANGRTLFWTRLPVSSGATTKGAFNMDAQITLEILLNELNLSSLQFLILPIIWKVNLTR